MTIQLVRLLALAALALGLAVSGPAIAAEKTHRAERFDVAIDVAADRSLLVTETIVFRFEGEPFTQVFRRLSTRRSDGISGIEGQLDGQVLPRGRRVNSLEVDRENGIEVTWRFSPTLNATRTVTLSYRVAGAVTEEPARDEFYWMLLPARHPYPIEAARVRVTLPLGVRLAGVPEVAPTSAAVTVEGSGVAIEAIGLGPDATVVLRLAFEPGAFDPAPPRWQARQRLNRRYLPVFLVLAGSLLAAGVLGMIVFRRAHAYEGSAGDHHERPLPPDDLPAGLAGALLQVGARASWPQGFGTLIDLAGRGIVHIEEGPARRGRGRQFLVRLKERGTAAHPHEQRLLELIFRPRDEWQEAVPASDVVKRVGSGWKHVRHAMDAEMQMAGLTDPGREGGARALRNVGFLLLVVGAVGFLPAGLLVGRYGETILFVPGALDVLGVVALILAATFPRLSESGALRAQAWRGFVAYLSSVSKAPSRVADPGVFERYLPFAAAFGLGPVWVKSFAKRDQPVSVPPWFRSLADSPAAGLTAFTAFVASTSAVPGSHGGGIAGAGGGGASGAR